MPLRIGASGIHLIESDGSYPQWQSNHEIAITKVVDGSPVVMSCARQPTGVSYSWSDPTQVNNFTWGGFQFCESATTGTGFGYNYYITTATDTANQRWAPTEPGTSTDQLPYTLTSNVLAQGLNSADGTEMVRIHQGGFWLQPLRWQSTPAAPALNKRLVAETITTINYKIGMGGNDHIISIDSSVIVPADPIVQAATLMSFIPFYHFNPNYSGGPSFDTQEWVNFTTGDTRVYSAGETSTTEVVICRRADNAAAMATVYGPGSLGDSGFYKGRSGGGVFGHTVAYGFPVKTYPNGIPAGVAQFPAALCYGTRADVITAVVTAYANLQPAVYQ